jgi:predicted phage terminase large subunit-like protein
MLADFLLKSYNVSPTSDTRQALHDAARQELARRELLRFAQFVDPKFTDARHLRIMVALLERARRREIDRLMIFAPPRHGKSKLTSELFPAWALGIDPTEQIILASHSVSLAETFSRNVRNLLADDVYRQIFPRTRLSSDSATIQKWTLDGFTRPAMMALGVGGSPTGHGARILIIDDPIGSAEEAESANQRESLYRWYTDTIYPRLEPNAVIILMMQRWHEDDLAGRLLRDQARADRWTVLNLPALALTQSDPLARAPGEALWPERYNAEELARIQAVNPRAFEAKYQQQPRPAEGAMFKSAWLKIRNAAEVDLSSLQWVRYYDLAYSIKQQGHLTATISSALGDDGTIYLRRGRAAKLESPDVRRLVKETILSEHDVRHGIEAKANGGPIIQDLLRERELVGFSFVPIDVVDDKIVRATPVADRAEIGKLVFVRESVNDDGWIKDWIDELCSFPFGAYDDRVDSVSGCFAMLSKPKTVRMHVAK